MQKYKMCCTFVERLLQLVRVALATVLGRLMIASQVEVNSASVCPEVIMSAVKENWKIASVVVQLQNLGGNFIWMLNSAGPPAIATKLDPNNIAIVQLLVLETATTVETFVLIKRVLQTFHVKCGRARFTTNQITA